MNTWELIQLQRSSPELFGLKSDWQSETFMSPEFMAERARDTYKDQTPQQILSEYTQAPGRLGTLFGGVASGTRPTDEKFLRQMYDILGSVTNEEKQWITEHPDWMQAYGKLVGAGAIKDTGGSWLSSFADNVLQPLTKAVVGGAIGMGAAGAIGYGAGLTSGQGLFGLGPELGLSGAWGGEALTGSEGVGTLMGGATGDTLGATSGSTLADLGYGGMFDSTLASATPTLSGTGVMEGLSALGSLGIPESIATGTASSGTIIEWLKDNPTVAKALVSGASGLINYFGSQSALDTAMEAAKELQESVEYSPYNVTGPAGSAMFSDGTASITLSDEQKALYDQYTGLANQYYSDVSGFDTNAYVSKYLDWMRETSKDYETRGFEQLTSKLLNTGMLSGEAGSRALGEYYKKMSDADLQRQMTAESAGLNRLNTMYNLFNTSAGNTQSLLSQPLDYAKLGAAMGSGQSSANAAAATYPWVTTGWQAAGTSDMWSNIANGLSNALGSYFSNNSSNNAGKGTSQYYYNNLFSGNLGSNNWKYYA